MHVKTMKKPLNERFQQLAGIKPLYENEYKLSDEEKDQLTDMTNGFVRKLTDIRGGNYSGDRLLAALQFVQLVIQDAEPMIYSDPDNNEVVNN